MRAVALALFLAPFACLWGQSDSGMLPRWEVVEVAEDLVQRVGDVEQILDRVDPSQWESGGAGYADQAVQVRRDLGYLRGSAQALALAPEKLSLVVDTFLWLDRLHSMLGSMTQGVRSYQSATLADLLESSQGNYSGAAERLKQYMRQLAVAAESEMEIAHEEAQRCRSELMKRPR